MADFSKCKQGDKLKSEKYGDVHFVAYEGEFSVYKVIGRKQQTLLTWTDEGKLWGEHALADLSIPPKTKTVKRYIGLVPNRASGDGFICCCTPSLVGMLSDAQDVHEIEFTVTEEGV